MPRPCKCRRVCALPEQMRFRPSSDCSGKSVVHMTVDEFETIRLIDLEGLSQAQCGERMGISRATVQSIYGGARVRLAQFLVQGRELVIRGGDYLLCPGGSPGCRHCRKHCNEGGKQP